MCISYYLTYTSSKVCCGNYTNEIWYIIFNWKVRCQDCDLVAVAAVVEQNSEFNNSSYGNKIAILATSWTSL